MASLLLSTQLKIPNSSCCGDKRKDRLLLKKLITLNIFIYNAGDLWSFNYYRSEFIVSPVPDVRVHKLAPGVDKFLIIASDGLWGVMKIDEAVKFVHNYDKCKMGDVSDR